MVPLNPPRAGSNLDLDIFIAIAPTAVLLILPILAIWPVNLLT